MLSYKVNRVAFITYFVIGSKLYRRRIGKSGKVCKVQHSSSIDCMGHVTTNGRPGTASIIKRRNSIKFEDKEISEEQRLTVLYKLLTRLREIESDRGVSYSTKSSMGSHQTLKSFNSAARAYIDNLIFRPVKENQVSIYAGNKSIDGSYCSSNIELFKVIQS